MTENMSLQPNRVAVIADTTTSIPDNLVNDLDIRLVPYYVNMEGKTLRDVVDIGREQFYRWLPGAQKLPTTSNPSIGDYLEAFRKTYERTKEMVTITMTSLGSGAYQTATIAGETIAQELPDIKVLIIDSRQVAMAHGWAVVEAARAAFRPPTLSGISIWAGELAARCIWSARCCASNR